MLKFMSKIGDAAYKTAAKTGIAAGSEMPPYPCAVPLQVVDDPSDVELVESILDAAYAGVQDLMGDLRMLNACDPEGKERPWKALDYTDSDGDIKLMSRKHMGPYNFARATVTFERVLPPQILSSMHTQDLKKRKEYSGNITEYIVIARNPKMPPSLIGKDDDHLVELARDGIRDWHFEYNQYYAPPPVATRDFVYLVEKRYVAAEDAWYIYGTSVDLQTPAVRQMEKEKKSAKCVRGAVMFGWRLARVGADTKATYISCMNPNGWTPTFLVAWVQTEIAKEFQCARRLMYKTYHTTVESPPAKPTRKHKTTAAAKQAATLEEPAPTQPPAARHCDPTAQQVGARSGPVEHQHRLPRPTTTTATTTTTTASARDVRPPGIQSVSVSPGVSTTSMPPRLASANMTTVLTPAELHYLQRSFSALYREDSYLSNELEMRSIFEDDLPTGVRALSASMGRFGVTPAQMEEDARLYDDEDPLMF